MENDKSKMVSKIEPSKCKNFPLLNPPPRSPCEVGGGGGVARYFNILHCHFDF